MPFRPRGPTKTDSMFLPAQREPWSSQQQLAADYPLHGRCPCRPGSELPKATSRSKHPERGDRPPVRRRERRREENLAQASRRRVAPQLHCLALIAGNLGRTWRPAIVPCVWFNPSTCVGPCCIAPGFRSGRSTSAEAGVSWASLTDNKHKPTSEANDQLP